MEEIRSVSSTKIFILLIILGSVIVSAGILALGQLIDRTIESVMILHDYFIVLAMMAGAGIISILFFGSAKHDIIRFTQLLSLTAAASVFLINITGTIGYIEYRLPEEDSAKSKIVKTFPFAHEPMFEIMEYAGLIGPIWAGLIASLTFYLKEKMFTNSGVKNTMIGLTSLAIAYCLFISLMGIVPTKIASVQG